MEEGDFPLESLKLPFNCGKRESIFQGGHDVPDKSHGLLPPIITNPIGAVADVVPIPGGIVKYPDGLPSSPVEVPSGVPFSPVAVPSNPWRYTYMHTYRVTI